jgi:hypothetical protein
MSGQFTQMAELDVFSNFWPYDLGGFVMHSLFCMHNTSIYSVSKMNFGVGSIQTSDS